MVASFFVTVGFTFELGTSDCRLSRGCISYSDRSLNAAMTWPAGWFIHRTHHPMRTAILPLGGGSPSHFDIPLWFILLLGGSVTCVLIGLDRRPDYGHCPCGYDLTGNVSGTCPECGLAATSGDDRARGGPAG